MTDKLPHNLLALFAPRPALRYLPPSDHAPENRKTHKISGVAAFMSEFEDYGKMDYETTESWFEKKERIKAEKREKQKELQNDDYEGCKFTRLLKFYIFGSISHICSLQTNLQKTLKSEEIPTKLSSWHV